MSALTPKADMCGATRDVRYGPETDIHTSGRFAVLNTTKPNSWVLFQPSFAKAVEIMLHRLWRKWEIFTYPSQRKIWLQLLEPIRRRPCLFHSVSLSKTRTQLAMGAKVFGSLLYNIMRVLDCLVIIPCLIMGMANTQGIVPT